MEGIGIFGCVLFIGMLLIFLGTQMVTQPKNTLTFGCITKGSTILSKSTPDRRYVTVYCVKNGRVVP